MWREGPEQQQQQQKTLRQYRVVSVACEILLISTCEKKHAMKCALWVVYVSTSYSHSERTLGISVLREICVLSKQKIATNTNSNTK